MPPPALIKNGIHAGLQGSGYKTLAEFDTPEWAPPKAQQWVSGQITRFGTQIVGVVAANDGTGGGADGGFQGGRRERRCRRSAATTRRSPRCN